MNKQRIESRLTKAEKQLPQMAMRAHLRAAFEICHNQDPTEIELAALVGSVENVRGAKALTPERVAQAIREVFGEPPSQHMNGAEAVRRAFGNPYVEG